MRVMVAGSSLTGELDASLWRRRRPAGGGRRGSRALWRGRSPCPTSSWATWTPSALAPASRLEAQGVEVVLLSTWPRMRPTPRPRCVWSSTRGADDITVYGALGGPRLDHLVGNLLLLSSPG